MIHERTVQRPFFSNLKGGLLFQEAHGDKFAVLFDFRRGNSWESRHHAKVITETSGRGLKELYDPVISNEMSPIDGYTNITTELFGNRARSSYIIGTSFNPIAVT